ncbi:unnamed protein product [Arabidopsis thaliana]|uniref:Uncharacterized protein n=1 Tax=Arabidopsis thaliana TaxID=3702 RepID=A0A654F928_ARATH|nr:unnamed protein product [Arabidopsis thaliana]
MIWDSMSHHPTNQSITRETHTDPSLKLESMNAVFHISFKANSCDYKSDICSSKLKISLHKFLHERIKVGGKPGALCYNQNKITVTSDGLCRLAIHLNYIYDLVFVFYPIKVGGKAGALDLLQAHRFV